MAPESKQSAPDEAPAGLADVVSSALGVGVAFARVIARATAGERAVAEPKEDAGPISVMIHYGMATASNLAGQVISGFNVRADPAPTASQTEAAAAPSPSPAQAAGDALPAVHQGGTLRIPLSIENPGPAPMEDMALVCLSISSEQQSAAGTPLDENALRFEPRVLSVAPKDFEKLTVFIDVGEDNAPGLYRAIIGLRNGSFRMPLLFKVLPAAPST